MTGETLRERLTDRPALDVSADLDIEVDGYPLTVESYTDHVVVSVPSLPAAWHLLRSTGPGRLRGVPELVAAADLLVELRVRGRPVARLGSGVSPGPTARGLGLGPLRLDALGLTLAALADRGASPDRADESE